MSPERRKMFDARVLEVTGKPVSEFDPTWDALEILGLPVLQEDGTVEWATPKNESGVVH